MESLNEEIITSIRRIVRSINLESKKIQKDFGISLPQLLCMSHLKNAEDFQLTQKEIVKKVHLNSSTLTGIVQRLEKKGYIARLPSKGDRRVSLLTLTSRGNDLIDKTPELLHHTLASKLDKMDESLLLQIKEGLDILVNAMEIEDLDASPLFVADEPGVHGE